jgi:hypothetical protein
VARERPKLFAVERSRRLRAVVCRQLHDGWSPASIAGRLPIDYPDDQARVFARGDLPVGLRPPGVRPGQGADQPADRTQGPVDVARRRRRGSANPATSTSAPPRPPTGHCLGIGREIVRRGKSHVVSGYTVWRLHW